MTWLLVVPAFIGLYVFFGIQTWVFYLAIANLQKVRDARGLSPIVQDVGEMLLFYGLVSDFIFNVLNTVPFLEFPREMLFTPRVARHCKGTGYRADLAKWFCATALDPFAKGEDHCGCHQQPA